MSRSRFRFLFLLVFMLAPLLPACENQPAETVESDFTTLEIPNHLLILDDKAKAFAVNPDTRLRLCRAVIPREWLLDYLTEGKIYVELHRVTGTGTRIVSHEIVRDGLEADLIPGETYLLMPRPEGSVRNTYRLMRSLQAARSRLDGIAPGLGDRICHYILCAPDIRPARTILSDLGKPGPRGEPPLTPGQIDRFRSEFPIPDGPIGGLPDGPPGGFPGGLGNICLVCTDWKAPPDNDDDEPDLPPTGTPIPTNPCRNTTETVFHADFEGDTPGSPPASLPAGLPTGDSIEITGGPDAFVVMNNPHIGSNSIYMTRTSGTDSDRMDCIIAGPAVVSGKVCVTFNAVLADTAKSAVPIQFWTRDDRELFNLTLSGLHYHSNGAAGNVQMDPEMVLDEVHSVKVVLDLDSKTYSVYLNGEMRDHQGFLTTWCVDFKHLEFVKAQASTEWSSLDYYVDDLEIRKEP